MRSFLHTIRLVLPVFFLVLLPGAFFFPGCEPGERAEVARETDERNYQRGKQLLREGRNQEALSAFLNVIERRRGEAPESHLEAGELFRTHIQDPVSAIYHYRKYLELKPGGEQADYVRQLIETAMKDFARTLPAHPMSPDSDRADLLDTVERLRRENTELKRELAQARQERDRFQAEAQRIASTRQAAADAANAEARISSGSSTAAEPEGAGTGERVRTYTVESGDTLMRISAQVYGTGNRWRDIYEANRDLLPNENSLRIGMELQIPE